jgi:hypothetical protein
MCGRAAQTATTTRVAAATFGVSRPDKAADVPSKGQDTDMVDSSSSGDGDRDNYNLSPGMDAAVIWIEHGELKMDRKVYVTFRKCSIDTA